MKFGLTLDQFKLIQDLIINPLKKSGAEVFIFGSRIRGDHHKYSDLDILYKPKLPLSIISKIKEDAEESNLTIKIDLVCFEDLATSYKENVLKEKVKV